MKNISLNLRKNTLVITLVSGVLCSFLFINSFKIDNKPQNKTTTAINKSSLVIKMSDSKIGFKDSNPIEKLKINKFEK